MIYSYMHVIYSHMHVYSYMNGYNGYVSPP